MHPGDRIRVAGSYILRPDEGVSISDVMTRGPAGFAELAAASFVRPAAEILAEESEPTVARRL